MQRFNRTPLKTERARAIRRFQSHTLAAMKGPSKNAAIAARDLAVVWHPCTQMRDHERLPLVPIERGEGVWLHDFDGRRYLDGISSWWVNLFGHANPRINAAIRARVRGHQAIDLSPRRPARV